MKKIEKFVIGFVLIGCVVLGLIFTSVHAVDYQCVYDCTQKGYQYGYCTKLCSY